MELRQLRTFIVIAETLNFTRAAESLGYAQSSVTTQIKLLEEELGARLFERLGKNVFLTAQGDRFLGYAKQIVSLSKEARDAVCVGDQIKGSLLIGSVESLCSTRFPRIYRVFHERYPQVDVTVKIASTGEIKKWLAESAIDLGFFLDTIAEDPDLTNALTMDEPMALLAAPCHPLICKRCVQPGDLQGEALILTESECSYRNRFEKILKAAGVVPRSVLESGNIQSIVQLTSSGMGLSFLPRIAVEAELKKGEIAALDWGGPAFDVFTALVYHKDKWVTPAMKAFIDCAAQVLREGELAS